MRNSTDFTTGQYMVSINSNEESLPRHSSDNIAANTNSRMQNIAEAAEPRAAGAVNPAGRVNGVDVFDTGGWLYLL